VSFTVEPDRKFRSNPLSFGSKTREQTGNYEYIHITPTLRAHFTQFVQFVLTFQRLSWNQQHVTQPITTTIQTATPPCAIQYRLTYPAITTATGSEKSPYCVSGAGDYQLSSLHHAAGVQRAAHIRRARHMLLQHHAVAVLSCLHPSPNTIRRSEIYNHLQNCAQWPLVSNEITPCRRVLFSSY
jgi:hypothetical protein